MRFSLGSVIVAFVGLVGLLTATEPVHAQGGPALSKDPAVFKAHLVQFIQLTRRNLRDIQALPDDDSIPVDRELRNRVSQAYGLVRAARWGIELAQNAKTYKDPMLDLAYNRIDQAMVFARYPVDNTYVPRAEYVSQSEQNLSRALRLVQQTLVILP